jgi:hypothetical protein
MNGFNQPQVQATMMMNKDPATEQATSHPRTSGSAMEAATLHSEPSEEARTSPASTC